MKAPFGISTDKTNPFKKLLDVSFQGIETNQSMSNFKKLVEDIDNLAIDYAVSNSESFFKKKLTKEVITEYYYSGIKKSKKEFPDTFKFKLNFMKPNPEKNNPNGRYITSFWDPNGNELNENQLDKGDFVMCLLKPKEMWVVNKSFGINWNCTQVKIHKQQKINGFAFKKTEDDVEETIVTSDEEEYEEQEVEVDA
jgi:hypothetical protein